MKSPTNLNAIASSLLQQTNLELTTCTPIQTLWAGYGHICHILATPAVPNSTTSPSSDQCSPSEEPQSLILKYIHPPSLSNYHRDYSTVTPDEGHIRKLLSYQIEQSFYTYLAPQLPPDIAVARCIGSINQSPASSTGKTTSTTTTTKTATTAAMILTDLRASFPVPGEKRGDLNADQVRAAIAWLAGFHGFWWRGDRIDQVSEMASVLPPLEHFAEYQSVSLSVKIQGGRPRLWRNGGYTYLATRRAEYRELAESRGSEWAARLCQPVGFGHTDADADPAADGDGDGVEKKSSVAEMVADVLASSKGGPVIADGRVQEYMTLLHGDVKSENLFTTRDGRSVAFYDFQYVGMGLGVSDLAKLFTVSVPVGMLVDTGYELEGIEQLGMGKGEETLLRDYLELVRKRSGKRYDWEVFVRHWETALVDWLRFQASWGFWGNSEWLEARVRSILADKSWIGWLRNADGH